jgi:hypothetical protein
MDGIASDTGVSQDVTFNGAKNTLASGPDDWGQVDLRQVGRRRNVASHAIVDAVGPLSLDQGQGDNGQGDNGAPPEIDFESAKDAPHLQSLTISKQPQGIVVKWSAPHVGTVYSYDTWRSQGPTIGTQRIVAGTELAPTTTFLDTSAKKNVIYTYFITAHVFEHGNTGELITTGMSNPGTIFNK